MVEQGVWCPVVNWTQFPLVEVDAVQAVECVLDKSCVDGVHMGDNIK